MRLEPMSRYREPAYPTHDALTPELLRALPHRWRGKAMVLAAMTCTTLLGGCRLAPDTGFRTPGVVIPTPMPVVVSKVAPLFGTTPSRGRIMGKVATPSFLTEAEALAIITYEAKAAGLAIDATTWTVPGLPNPVTTGATVSLQMDGEDAARRITCEFVSIEDYAEWQGTPHAITYSLQGPAEALRTGLEAAAPQGTVAVFYDPALHDPADARAALRVQVKEFLAWLRAEGVI